MTEILTSDSGYKYTVMNIPDLGTPTIEAGVNFFRLTWTNEQPLTLNRVDYKGDVTVTLEGKVQIFLRRAHTFNGDGPTPAADKVIIPAVERWFLSFENTTVATEILAATVAKHRGIDLSGLNEDIRKATEHLAELQSLKERIEQAGPTEYVSRYETKYALKERPR